MGCADRALRGVPSGGGALVRFLIRTGETPPVASELLRAVHALPGCEFWPASLSYADAGLAHVRGHRQ